MEETHERLEISMKYFMKFHEGGCEIFEKYETFILLSIVII